jgi:hypothetical protein
MGAKNCTLSSKLTPTSLGRFEAEITLRSFPFSKVEIINFGTSCGVPKFAQDQGDFLSEGVFTTQSLVKSQIVSALHVIVNGKCVVKTEFAPFAHQKHF